MAVTTPPGTGTADQDSALSIIQQTLAQYGLPQNLATWAWNEIVAGKTPDQVTFDLQQTPAFQQRFPAIAARQAAGLPPISPADYLSYEQSARQLMQAAGLPAGFYDKPADFTNLIANDVSLSELSQRVSDAQSLYYESPPSVQAAFKQYFGASAPSAFAAHALDPDVAEPVLHRQLAAAQIGGAAADTGFGQISATQAQALATQGVTASQAQSGFNQLAHDRQLFTPLPGETTTGVSQAQQMAAVFGNNAAAQDQITGVQTQRKGAFQSGGGFTQSGAGSAQQA